MKWKIWVLAAMLLTACATIPPYHPVGEGDGYGYAEQKIESNRFRVSFSGNAATSRQAVENFLLYRAAELTTETGNTYFVIIENETEVHTSYSVTSRFPRYGRRAYFIGPRSRYYNYPYYSYGFDWGLPYDDDIQDVHEHTRYSAEAYITVHNDLKPEAHFNVFTAREVLENLRPFIEKSSGE